jgi:hypothetical protein
MHIGLAVSVRLSVHMIQLENRWVTVATMVALVTMVTMFTIFTLVG